MDKTLDWSLGYIGAYNHGSKDYQISEEIY